MMKIVQKIINFFKKPQAEHTKEEVKEGNKFDMQIIFLVKDGDLYISTEIPSEDWDTLVDLIYNICDGNYINDILLNLQHHMDEQVFNAFCNRLAEEFKESMIEEDEELFGNNKDSRDIQL